MGEAPQIRILVDFLYDSVCEKFKLGGTADDIKGYLRKAGIDEQTTALCRHDSDQCRLFGDRRGGW